MCGCTSVSPLPPHRGGQGHSRSQSASPEPVQGLVLSRAFVQLMETRFPAPFSPPGSLPEATLVAPAGAGKTKVEKGKMDPSWARRVLSARNLGLALRESGSIWDVLSSADGCAQELWAAFFRLVEQQGKGTSLSLVLLPSEATLPPHPWDLGDVPAASSQLPGLLKPA